MPALRAKHRYWKKLHRIWRDFSVYSVRLRGFMAGIKASGIFGAEPDVNSMQFSRHSMNQDGKHGSGNCSANSARFLWKNGAIAPISKLEDKRFFVIKRKKEQSYNICNWSKFNLSSPNFEIWKELYPSLVLLFTCSSFSYSEIFFFSNSLDSSFNSIVNPFCSFLFHVVLS